MRKLLLLFTLALWLTLGSASASAQIRFNVTLPFAFQVENTTFPAGTYDIGQEAPNKDMTIRAQKGSQAANVNVTPMLPERLSKPRKTWLIFHRYGDKYFLREVWSKHIGRELPVSQAEKQLRDSGIEMTPVKVELHM